MIFSLKRLYRRAQAVDVNSLMILSLQFVRNALKKEDFEEDLALMPQLVMVRAQGIGAQRRVVMDQEKAIKVKRKCLKKENLQRDRLIL